MIFVTVGTHEQQFDRLVKEIDNLIDKNIITEDVFIQLGYCNYKPKNCEYKKMISIEDMNKYSKDANIVITHGGPGSIMLPFMYNKVPIVVPRQVRYSEHVDNHQVLFSKYLEKEKKIIPIYEIEKLKDKIVNYDYYSKLIKNNIKGDKSDFITKFNQQIKVLMNN